MEEKIAPQGRGANGEKNGMEGKDPSVNMITNQRREVIAGGWKIRIN